MLPQDMPKRWAKRYVAIVLSVAFVSLGALFSFWKYVLAPCVWENSDQHGVGVFAWGAFFVLAAAGAGLCIVLILDRIFSERAILTYLRGNVPGGTMEFVHTFFDRQLFPFCWNPLTPLNGALAFQCFGASYVKRAMKQIKLLLNTLAKNLNKDTNPTRKSMADHRIDATTIRSCFDKCFDNEVLNELIEMFPDGNPEGDQLKGLFQEVETLAFEFRDKVSAPLNAKPKTDEQASELINDAGAAASELLERTGGLHRRAARIRTASIESLRANRSLVYEVRRPCRP